MRPLNFYISAAALVCSMTAVQAKENKFPDYSMVLIGGGLKTCSSVSTRYCSEQNVFSDSAKAADEFRLSPQNIANIGNKAFWGEERAIEQHQTLAILEFIRSRTSGELVSERELLRLWRSAETEMDGIWVSGRVNYAALTEREVNFVLDQLQEMSVSAAGSKTKPLRKKEYADLAKTTDADSVAIYRKIVELAQQIAGNQRKPRILVVTASGRDPFAAVDFYTNVFSELGANVTWLPLNAAYQAAQAHKVNDAPSCDNLNSYLEQLHGTYQRGRVYPDLMAELDNFCRQGSEEAVQLIKRSDAVFFNGGDQSLTVKALRFDDGSASPELQQIEAMLSQGNIIVAGTSAGTAVMSGGSFAGRRTPMITNGDSYSAMQFGAFDLPAPQPGCDKDQTCSNGLAENHLTYSSAGGLGLFPWGVLDTHFSERGRHGRLVRLLNDSQSRFGFGIDENTALLVGFSEGEAAPQASMSVIGTGGVFVADTMKAQRSGEGAAVSISNVATHYLTREDRMDLKDGVLRTRFAEWKYSPSTTLTPLLSSGELFERDNYRQLAHLLCTTQSRSADGRAVRVGQGHNVRLYKEMAAQSRQGVYRQQEADVQYCSYRNLMLDIAPAN